MNKYIELLKTGNGKFEDLCYELYQMLKKEKNEIVNKFQLICEMVSEIDSDESKKIDSHFAEGEIDDLKDLYGNYIDQAINSARKKTTFQKLGAEEFYSLLWDMVMNNSLLVTDKEKAFGLLWILADDGIPYYELGEPLSMENDEYREILKNNQKAVERIKYILSIPFEQKTEVSSLILQDLLTFKDYKIQTVLLAQALNIQSQREMRKLKNVIEVIKSPDKSE